MRTAPLDRLLWGAATFAVGFGLGLLVAPRSGEEARRRLAEGAYDAALTAQLRARGAAAPLAARVRETSHELAQRHVPLADDWDVVDGRDLLKELQGLPRS